MLPTSTRRRVEKLAVPPGSFEGEPLRAILRQIVGGDFAADARLALRLDPAQGRTGDASLLLFALLYGKTLAGVAEQSALGDGRQLTIDDRLQRIVWPVPHRFEDEEDPDEPWTSVHLALWDAAEDAPYQRFRWSPQDRDGFAALVALIGGHASPAQASATVDLEAWAAEMARALLEDEPLAASASAVTGGLTAEWRSERSRHLATWAAHGLDAESLDRYVDAWSKGLLRAREELVPGNSPLPELDAWLDMDTVKLAGGRVALLATHPLRMRWFAAHLRRMGVDLVAALEGRFNLNPENDTLYFESVARVSPHRQPPIVVVGGADEVLASTREFGLHEEYAPAHRGIPPRHGSAQSMRALCEHSPGTVERLSGSVSA